MKFLSVIPWTALVPRILRFTDFEEFIIAALADGLQSKTGLFLTMCYFHGLLHSVSGPDFGFFLFRVDVQ